METLVAIDPSLTGMAVCVWRQSQDTPLDMGRFESKNIGDSAWARIERYKSHANNAGSIIDSMVPDWVLIEGYSFNSRGSVIHLGEFGAILRLRILQAMARLGISPERFIEVAPKSIKKFATDNGNAGKPLMAGCVAKRWGAVYQNDDETDAYVLAQLGRCLAGWVEPETAFMRDVVAQVRGEKPVKAKRKKSA